MRHRPMLLCAAMLSLLLGSQAIASPASQAGTCQIACDRASASCEHKFGRNGKCQRTRQSCNDQCSLPPEDLRTTKQRRLELCTQRCDLNRHTCEEANHNNEKVCSSGQSNCIKRCK